METKNIHRVKCYQRFFKLTESGIKPFEVRRNDRDYQVGDLLELSETVEGSPTGRMMLFEIISILTSADFPDGIKEEFAVLGIKPITGVYYDVNYGAGSI